MPNFVATDNPGLRPVTSATVLTGGLSTTPHGSGQETAGTRGLRRWRMWALVAGSVAALMMAIVGCSTITGGKAVVNTKAAPAYRASMSASVSASAATSSARESERQASLTTAAVHSTCEVLSTTSADAIDTVNKFVTASNQGGDVAGTEGPAVDALNKSADAVANDMNDATPQDLRDAFNGWVDAARAVAAAISGHVSPGEFNKAVNRVNDARSHALSVCDSWY
jgi:hypothetical protein